MTTALIHIQSESERGKLILEFIKAVSRGDKSITCIDLEENQAAKEFNQSLIELKSMLSGQARKKTLQEFFDELPNHRHANLWKIFQRPIQEIPIA